MRAAGRAGRAARSRTPPAAPDFHIKPLGSARADHADRRLPARAPLRGGEVRRLGRAGRHVLRLDGRRRGDGRGHRGLRRDRVARRDVRPRLRRRRQGGDGGAGAGSARSRSASDRPRRRAMDATLKGQATRSRRSTWHAGTPRGRRKAARSASCSEAATATASSSTAPFRRRDRRTWPERLSARSPPGTAASR